MGNQYCKVGTTTPITSGTHAVAVLEHRYNNFLERAANLSGMDTKMRDFFDAKIKSLKKTLESLV